MQITSKNYIKEVEQSKIPVIIDFYADWCMPCRMMAQVFEKLDKDYEGKVKFVKVDVDSNSDIASKFGIMGIPTLALLKEGEEIDRIVGFAPENILKAKINELL